MKFTVVSPRASKNRTFRTESLYYAVFRTIGNWKTKRPSPYVLSYYFL